MKTIKFNKHLTAFEKHQISKKCRNVNDNGDIIFNESMFDILCLEKLRKKENEQ